MTTNGEHSEVTERRRTKFTGKQLIQIEEIVDHRIAQVLQPVVNEFAELIPFVKSLKAAADAKTKFWVWMRSQAEQVASTNIKYAINAGLWFTFLIVVLGVMGAWGQMWAWAKSLVER